MKILWNVSIKNAYTVEPERRDMEVEIFVNRREPSFKTSLQFMPAIMCGKTAGQITLTESAILRRLYRSGSTIRPKASIRVTTHRAELS